MSRSREMDRFSNAGSSLSSAAVRQWLAAERWALTQEKQGIAELWSRPEGERNGKINHVLVPLAESFADYGRRFAALLDDLGRAYNLTAAELTQEIASVSTDMFFVRLDQAMADGTIPFKQATALLNSIQKMVRAAATTAADPKHSHVGRRPAAVTEFIDEDLRFGHTKRGSFIITVAARLDHHDDSHSPIEELGSTGEVKPFSRRVMETLVTGLLATKHHLAEGDAIEQYQNLETAQSNGMSLELVQSLIEVSAVEGLKSVDLSFQWAAAGPPPPNVENEVRIEAVEVPGLEKLRDRLILKEEPQEQTLMGRVTDLSREDIGGGQEERSILLEAEINGGLKKVRVPLSPTEYDWAIFAHQRRLPLTVTGTPVRRQRWGLEGSVFLDSRFLESVAQIEEESGRTVASTD